MYKYTLVGDFGKEELVFETRAGVFSPTGTSDLLIRVCRSSISSPKKVLDLGCGCGLVGIVLARLGLCREPLFASDVGKDAIALARENASRMSVEYVARRGSLFDPWEDEKFDVIVDDVAGLSDDIARISPWYPDGVDCNAGRDGTKWIIQIIEQSKQHLTEGGMFIFPVLSLSNEEKILRVLEETYSSYDMVAKRDWFLPDEMADRTDILMPLMDDGTIRFRQRLGKWVWSTYIYRTMVE